MSYLEKFNSKFIEGNRYQKKLIILVATILVFFESTDLIFELIFPCIGEFYEKAAPDLARVNTIKSFGTLFGIIISNVISRYIRPDRFIIFGLIFFIPIYFTTYINLDFVAVQILFFFYGMSIKFFSCVINQYVDNLIPDNRKQRWSIIIGLFVFLGKALAIFGCVMFNTGTCKTSWSKTLALHFIILIILTVTKFKYLRPYYNYYFEKGMLNEFYQEIILIKSYNRQKLDKKRFKPYPSMHLIQKIAQNEEAEEKNFEGYQLSRPWSTFNFILIVFIALAGIVVLSVNSFMIPFDLIDLEISIYVMIFSILGEFIACLLDQLIMSLSIKSVLNVTKICSFIIFSLYAIDFFKISVVFHIFTIISARAFLKLWMVSIERYINNIFSSSRQKKIIIISFGVFLDFWDALLPSTMVIFYFDGTKQFLYLIFACCGIFTFVSVHFLNTKINKGNSLLKSSKAQSYIKLSSTF